ncbi:hypothetical protein [Mycolicibacterium sp. A43C]
MADNRTVEAQLQELYKDEIAADEDRRKAINRILEESRQAWQQAAERHHPEEQLKAAAQAYVEQRQQMAQFIDERFQDQLKNMGIIR